MLQIGLSHPDRNAQFEHINQTAHKYIEANNPLSWGVPENKFYICG